MAGRFYIAPIVGSHTEGYRALTRDLMEAARQHGSLGCSIPTDGRGDPLHRFALVFAPDCAALNDDAAHFALPDVDARWEDLDPATQQACQLAFSDRFGLTLVPDPHDTCGDVLSALGKALLDGEHFEASLLMGGD